MPNARKGGKLARKLPLEDLDSQRAVRHLFVAGYKLPRDNFALSCRSSTLNKGTLGTI